nr:hypothetical protein [Tanacetum cinerariifolium]
MLQQPHMKILVEKTPWLEQCLQKTDAKSGSVDGGFVASVFGGGMDVDLCGGGVKYGNDRRMTVENTGEESGITET